MSLSYIQHHHGDLARLNLHVISGSARKSHSFSLFRIFQIQFAVDLNTWALSDIIHRLWSCSMNDKCIKLHLEFICCLRLCDFKMYCSHNCTGEYDNICFAHLLLILINHVNKWPSKIYSSVYSGPVKSKHRFIAGSSKCTKRPVMPPHQAAKYHKGWIGEVLQH